MFLAAQTLLVTKCGPSGKEEGNLDEHLACHISQCGENNQQGDPQGEPVIWSVKTFQKIREL